MIQESCLRLKFALFSLLIAPIIAMPAQAINVTEYVVPTANSGLGSITAGPDGALWFTEATGNKIGRITPGGTITEFPLPTANSNPGSIVAGPDGNLWFTEHTPARIARITPNGTITEFPLADSNAKPYSLVAGKKGPLWYIISPGGNIGGITTSGVITEHTYDNVRAIIADNDGNLWVAQNRAFASPGPNGGVREQGSITKMTPDGERTMIFSYSAGIPISINGLAVGPDENIWHATQYPPLPSTPGPPSYLPPRPVGGYLSKQTTASPISGISTGELSIFNFITGPDGNFWFLTNGATAFGRLTLSGALSFYEFGNDHSYNGLTVGPDRNFWFTDGARNVIGKLVLDSSSPNTVAIIRASNYYGGSLAAESIATLFGAGLTNTIQLATSLPLPESLGGISVKIKDAAGVERAAPLFYVSPTQINLQVPAGLANGNAAITVTGSDGRTISTGSTIIDRTAPGLFSADASGKGLAAAVVARVKADGSVVYEPVARLDAENKLVAAPIDFGAESDQLILALFGSGLRGYQSACGSSGANCQIGSRVGLTEAPVTYIGPQGSLVGVDQINILLPRALPRNVTARINLTINGNPLNAVEVVFK
ncbi:MAG: virginiamycin B lyase family protein [Blastocatellia bacterium]